MNNTDDYRQQKIDKNSSAIEILNSEKIPEFGKIFVIHKNDKYIEEYSFNGYNIIKL